MYFVQPSDKERYFMRMLLHHVPGAVSYEDLRTVNRGTADAKVADSYQEACEALGLLQNDDEWFACMQEASRVQCDIVALRVMFASILAYNNVKNAVALWDKYKHHLAVDIMLKAGKTELDDVVTNEVLLDLQQHLRTMGRTMAQAGLPIPTARVPVANESGNDFIADEARKYNMRKQAERADVDVPMLNSAQRTVYDAVMEAVLAFKSGMSPPRGNAFFVDGLGGAGKTFLYGCLLSKLRGQGDLAIAVASSGIAALLLEGGRTVHSRFKVPLNIHADSTCKMERGSQLAEFIERAALIVWDEAPMMHKHAFEAVDRTLRDIMRVDEVFGGKIVVMGGDFRQVLPVIKRGTPGQIVDACLNRSTKIWQHVREFRLHVNMRVQRLLAAGGPDAEQNARRQQQFADYLKALGEGSVDLICKNVGENAIMVPEGMRCGTGEATDKVETLTDAVYGDLNRFCSEAYRSEFIIERAILTPLNEDVDAINAAMDAKYSFKKADGSDAARRVYYSSDTLESGEQQGLYPVEFLNSLNFSGLPPHELRLQEGCPIILLRNMSNGLANGTRLIVQRLMANAILAKVAAGPQKGQDVLISRVTLTPSDTEFMPFTINRRQFPVRPAFAMTINKAQGQTLKMVGVFLPSSVFAHGQLYVAISRVGSADAVKIMVRGGRREATPGVEAGIYTDNIVYHDVFKDVR
jgi:ATP-dependent DNA helicase PIF1